MKLNIGCKNDLREGYINIDIADWGQEVTRDITRGLPYSDETVSEVYSSHFFEHLKGEDVSFVLDECVRVLKSGGKLIVRLPHSDCQESCYLGHVSYWNEAVVRDEAKKREVEMSEMGRSGIELYFTWIKK